MRAEVAARGPSAGIDVAAIEAVGAQSLLPVEARQAGTEPFADHPVRGLDDEFLATTCGLSAVAVGYDSDAAVWRAMADQPGLAVVDPFVAPRRNEFMFGVPPDFQLHGFLVEDGMFDPVDVEVRDPATGAEMTLTVIGVLDDSVPWEMAGITTSQRTLAPSATGRHPRRSGSPWTTAPIPMPWPQLSSRPSSTRGSRRRPSGTGSTRRSPRRGP
jgi:hypothetical protein